MLETSARLLRLLSLLQTHPTWSGPELAGRLGVSTRTIRTDVERLRELGYPVHATPGVAGGYRLGAGAKMPPLLLDDEEAVAVAVGLRAAAGGSIEGIEETSLRALAKLEQVLPSRLRRRVGAMHEATLAVNLFGDGPVVDPETLTTIAAAVRDRERLRFGYRAKGAEPSRRQVEPERMVSVGRRWYLVGWDADRDDWRTFRVDRISEPTGTGVRFTSRELPAEDAAAYLRQVLAAMQPRHQAVITLYIPLATAADRVPAALGDLEPVDDQSCLLRTTPGGLQWLGTRIAGFDFDYEVHSPPELVEHLRVVAARLARATGTPRSPKPKPYAGRLSEARSRRLSEA
jgi:predicted DNA-binding transcriptional regulator YafY